MQTLTYTAQQCIMSIRLEPQPLALDLTPPAQRKCQGIPVTSIGLLQAPVCQKNMGAPSGQRTLLRHDGSIVTVQAAG